MSRLERKKRVLNYKLENLNDLLDGLIKETYILSDEEYEVILDEFGDDNKEIEKIILGKDSTISEWKDALRIVDKYLLLHKKRNQEI